MKGKGSHTARKRGGRGKARKPGISRGLVAVTAGARPFLRHHRRYDRWFDLHRPAYHSELLALRALLPWGGRGLEIGVGTGRFAAPLGVAFGIDPALTMLNHARARGVTVAGALARALPFANAVFDYALIVTTICFVDDPAAMLAETHRVLRPGGILVIGFIDRTSNLGRHYLAHQAEDPFYREARFYSAVEVQGLLRDSGFAGMVWVQTLFKPLDQTLEIEAVRSGRGEGAFVGVKVSRP